LYINHIHDENCFVRKENYKTLNYETW